MHFRIPFLLALATGALADFGYELFTSGTSECEDNDRSMLSAALESDDAENDYVGCHSVGSNESKWLAFKPTTPAGWKVQVYGQPDCGGNPLTVGSGKCFQATKVIDAKDPHEILSFSMYKN